MTKPGLNRGLPDRPEDPFNKTAGKEQSDDAEGDRGQGNGCASAMTGQVTRGQAELGGGHRRPSSITAGVGFFYRQRRQRCSRCLPARSDVDGLYSRDIDVAARKLNGLLTKDISSVAYIMLHGCPDTYDHGRNAQAKKGSKLHEEKRTYRSSGPRPWCICDRPGRHIRPRWRGRSEWSGEYRGIGLGSDQHPFTGCQYRHRSLCHWRMLRGEYGLPIQSLHARDVSRPDRREWKPPLKSDGLE